MNVEVEIYLTQFTSFFNKNPKELKMLIGDVDKEVFFEKVKEQSNNNSLNGEDPCLTRQQILNILVKLRTNEEKKDKNIEKVVNNCFEMTKFGEICLN